jgi:hypothetical protein
LHILCRRAIHSLAMEVRDRVVCFHLQFEGRRARKSRRLVSAGASWPYLFNEACNFFACSK